MQYSVVSWTNKNMKKINIVQCINFCLEVKVNASLVKWYSLNSIDYCPHASFISCVFFFFLAIRCQFFCFTEIKKPISMFAPLRAYVNHVQCYGLRVSKNIVSIDFLLLSYVIHFTLNFNVSFNGKHICCFVFFSFLRLFWLIICKWIKNKWFTSSQEL